MTQTDQVQPQSFDESALAHPRHATDAQTKRAAGVRQQRGEQGIALFAVIGSGGLQQGDGLGHGTALAHGLMPQQVLLEGGAAGHGHE